MMDDACVVPYVPPLGQKTMPSLFSQVFGTFKPNTDESARDRWSSELREELDFWRHWMRTKGGQWPADYRARLDPATPLQPRVCEFLPDRDVAIIDVGAGPLTALGKKRDASRVTITAVDALAETYDELLAENGIEPPVRTQYCEAEKLSERFAPASFDLAYAQNALDHSYAPMEAIRQMLILVRPQRYVLLRHARNEAVAQRYAGLHQWNFDLRGDRFVIWNEKSSIDVADEIGKNGEVRTWLEDQMINVAIRSTDA
jgi:SAM-dependent methyltransferase